VFDKGDNNNPIELFLKRSEKSQIRIFVFMEEQRHRSIGHLLLSWNGSSFRGLAAGQSDLPHTDQVIRVAGKERLSVGGPGEGGAGRSLGLGVSGENFGLQFIHDDLSFQIPDFDGGASGGAEPVSVGREGKGVDGVAAIQRIKMFAFVKIPEHGLAVLATGSAKRTVGRHGHRVQVTRVTDVVRLQLAVGQVPHLDEFVPSGGDDDGVVVGRGKTDAGNPFRVSVLLDGVFANAKRVPQLDRPVAGTRNDLSVVGGESDAEDVLGVSDKSSGGRSHRQVPKTQSGIPRTGQSKLSVRRQHNVRHEVSVALERLVGDAVVGLILG